jgi:PucR C-terminal helix-turn-helix domain
MLADVLRPVLPDLSDEIIAAIAVEVPEYARPMEGAFGRAVRMGVERALTRFLDDDRRGYRVYFELGRGEMRQGRSLDALLSAYRIGARLAWRRFVDAGRAAGVAPDELYTLGESIFAYIDALSAESIDGYASEQSAAAGETARRRTQLVRMVIGEPAPDDEELTRLAGELQWPIPRRLAVLVIDDTEAVALDAMTAVVDGRTVVLIADPRVPGLNARLERLLRGRHAALGPEVHYRSAARSLSRAQLTLAVTADDDPRGLVVAEQHLEQLVLRGDPTLGGELASVVLAPLRELPSAAQVKLTATLRTWLDHQGRVEATAAALSVHPQTVRYRLAQLREIFGATLDEADGRFRLALALRLG